MVNLLYDLEWSRALSSQPATVSRCGMIYLEPSSLGWRPIMKSWINALPAVLTKDNQEILEAMMEWIIDPSLRFVTKNCKVCLFTAVGV